VVVLDLSRVFDVEYSALKALIAGERRLRAAGIDVVFAGLNPAVLDMVRRSPLAATLGPDRMALNLEMALERVRANALKTEPY
jgi:hypothetical protein